MPLLNPVSVALNENARNTGLANTFAQIDAEAAASKARMAEDRANVALRGAAEAQQKAQSDDAALARMGSALDQERINRVKLQLVIEEKDRMIVEWMHSNEAFKRLAQKYGNKFGVTDEQQKEDRANMVLDVAEENPKYVKTELTAKAKTLLNK